MRFWPALSAEPTPDFVSAIRWYRPRQRIYQQYHDWGSCAYNVKRAGSREGPTGKGGHNEGRPYLKGRHRRYEPRLTGTPFTLYAQEPLFVEQVQAGCGRDALPWGRLPCTVRSAKGWRTH